jgi:hypothetical protein
MPFNGTAACPKFLQLYTAQSKYIASTNVVEECECKYQVTRIKGDPLIIICSRRLLEQEGTKCAGIAMACIDPAWAPTAKIWQCSSWPQPDKH